jgi:hypothetical protein
MKANKIREYKIEDLVKSKLKNKVFSRRIRKSGKRVRFG